MPSTADTITLSGLEVFAHHGVFDHERVDGQPFIVDLVLSADLAGAAATDDLARTIDYAAVADVVVRVVSGGPYKLIETVAARVGDALLAGFDLSEVVVTIHKPQAPIPHRFSDVSVTITRRR
jgi:dihydroneopterin aldolase